MNVCVRLRQAWSYLLSCQQIPLKKINQQSIDNAFWLSNPPRVQVIPPLLVLALQYVKVNLVPAWTGWPVAQCRRPQGSWCKRPDAISWCMMPLLFFLKPCVLWNHVHIGLFFHFYIWCKCVLWVVRHIAEVLGMWDLSAGDQSLCLTDLQLI